MWSWGKVNIMNENFENIATFSFLNEKQKLQKLLWIPV